MFVLIGEKKKCKQTLGNALDRTMLRNLNGIHQIALTD